MRGEFEEIHRVVVEECVKAKSVCVDAHDLDGLSLQKSLQTFENEMLRTLDDMKVNLDSIETKVNEFREHTEDGFIE